MTKIIRHGGGLITVDGVQYIEFEMSAHIQNMEELRRANDLDALYTLRSHARKAPWPYVVFEEPGGHTDYLAWWNELVSTLYRDLEEKPSE